MDKEDARRILSILDEVDFETRLTKGKGATSSALIAYAKGMGLSIMRLDELIEVFIKAGIIHKKFIGKRCYFRLGES